MVCCGAGVCSRAHFSNLTCLGLYLGRTIWCRSKHGASDGDLRRGEGTWLLPEGQRRWPEVGGFYVGTTCIWRGNLNKRKHTHLHTRSWMFRNPLTHRTNAPVWAQTHMEIHIWLQTSMCIRTHNHTHVSNWLLLIARILLLFHHLFSFACTVYHPSSQYPSLGCFSFFFFFCGVCVFLSQQWC